MGKHTILLNTIAGDVIGSKYEISNIYSTDFELYQSDMHITDDTILTVATAAALLKINEKFPELEMNSIEEKSEIIKIFEHEYYRFGNMYNDSKYLYGSNFKKWLSKPERKLNPYNSFGNGVLMRVSPVIYFADTIYEAQYLAECSAMPTHNHLKSLLSVSRYIRDLFMVLNFGSKTDGMESDFRIIENVLSEGNLNCLPYTESAEDALSIVRYVYSKSLNELSNSGDNGFDLNSLLKDIEKSKNLPEATIKNAISLGGDSDTIAIVSAAYAECAITKLHYLNSFKSTLDEDKIREYILKEEHGEDLLNVIEKFDALVRQKKIQYEF